MSNQVENSTRSLRTVKVAEEIWGSVSHESTDRKTGIGALFAVAWGHFMRLPTERREAMAREFAASKDSANNA